MSISRSTPSTDFYLGSSLVFRTVFAMVADKSGDTCDMSQIERMQKGVKIALADLNMVNIHFNGVLYGIISDASTRPSLLPNVSACSFP